MSLAGLNAIRRPAAARGLFITGTDSGVGKTIIAGALCRVLRDMGRRVGVMKPIAAGCEQRDRGRLVNEDAEFLAHCADTPRNLDDVNPVRYSEPLAPAVAAERSKTPVDFAAIGNAYDRICADCDVVVIEGVGGWKVPIHDRVMLSDLAVRFDLPVVVVARAGLGTINHTLLTIDAIRQTALPLAGVVLNHYQPDRATIAEETNPEVIAKHTGLDFPVIVPFDKSVNLKRGSIGEDVLHPLRQGIAAWSRQLKWE
jgi:dethiobiotin synthetase